MSVRLRLLGGVAVEHAGHEVQVVLDRPVSLLVYLALRGDRVSRAELALLYRPDASDVEALAYLRKLIFRARRFEWAAGIEISADYLRWQVDSDVADFRAAAAAKQWNVAVSLYGGPLLGKPDIRAAPGLAAWFDLEEESLTALWLQAAASEAGRLQESGLPGSAAEVLNRALTADPLREELLQALLRALNADGRQVEAIRAFERFRTLLLDEVDAVPLESTLALLDSIRQQSGNPVRARPSTPELPETLTGFVGRQVELGQLAELFASGEERLISIVGLGGSGKTRLALEAARRYGVASTVQPLFVSFAGVTDSAEVAPALVSALGLSWEGGEAERAVIDGLGFRERLLILDNFEEVLPAASFLTRLLEAAPGIRLLVTSREPLGMSAEHLLRLGGLETPDEAETPTTQFEAIRLFLRRALRSDPGFTATGATLSVIADICRQLEGLPLAIELAAYWTRLLSVTELRSRLAGRSPLLTSNLRDLPERHRSVWTVFDHTWDSLTDGQRDALIRLSVFRGGFTLTAACTAAGAGLDLLLGLLDRLLVRRYGEDRFMLHELVRQYALSRADEQQLQAAQERHSVYYCSLLSGLAPDLKGRDVVAGLEAVDRDIGNFETAWMTAVSRRDVTALDSAREALDYWFYYRARFEQAREAFGTAADALRPAAAEGAAARRLLGLLLTQLAEKEFAVGEFTQAFARTQEALVLLSSLDSRVDEAHARLVLANGLVRQSLYHEARPHFAAVLESATAGDDAYLQGAAHNGLATLFSYIEGDLLRAQEHYRASLVAHRRIGNIEGVSGALTNLGACRFDLDDLDEAGRLWHEAAELAVRVGFRDREAALLNNLGSLAETSGRLDEAEQSYARSLDLRREVGNRPGIANVLNNFGRLALRQQDPVRAARLLREAAEIHRELGDRSGVSQSGSYLTRALLLLGQLDEAEQQLADALEHAVSASFRDLLGTLFSAAQLLEANGQPHRAFEAANTVMAGAAGNLASLHAEAMAMLARLAESAEKAPGDSRLLSAEELAAELLLQLGAGTTPLLT